MSFTKDTKKLWFDFAKQNNLSIEKDGAYPITIQLAQGSKAIISLGYNTHYDDFYITTVSIQIYHDFLSNLKRYIYNIVKFPAWNENHIQDTIFVSHWLKANYPTTNKFIIKNKDELNSFFAGMVNYINEIIPVVFNQTNSLENIYNELFLKREDEMIDKWNSFRDHLFIKLGIVIVLNDQSKLAEFEKTMVQQHSKSPDYLHKAEEVMALLKDDKIIEQLRQILSMHFQFKELKMQKLVFHP
ncbi:MAG: hypothetical protein IPN79_18950 [Saprospiraceae bacterium]|nr:hypothetical protein [Saprospiraceae bacterium]